VLKKDEIEIPSLVPLGVLVMGEEKVGERGKTDEIH